MKPGNPHPIPYQGSKRNLAFKILSYFPSGFSTLFEPFAGSAAVTIAAAAQRLGERYYINDLNKPLMALWQAIIETPEKISSQYEDLWLRQFENPRSFYDLVRADFNRTGKPEQLLYLLARCVKGSVRYNAQGEFNQSPDNRRRGMKPETMRLQIHGASFYLKGKTTITSIDYREVLQHVTSADFVYMDPPYQGVSGNRDPRYLQNVQLGEFVQTLDELNRRGIRYVVSYDGRTGDKTHGKRLPSALNLIMVELIAGRSSQATLLGRSDITVESLYLSPNLAGELTDTAIAYQQPKSKQLYLLEDYA